jgi:hypothetical protein
VRRKGRERMIAEGRRPIPWYDKFFFWLGFQTGVILVIWGDTVERIFGASIVAFEVGLITWAAAKVLREGKWRDDP